MYHTLEGADALVIATEWNEFRTPEFDRVAALMPSLEATQPSLGGVPLSAEQATSLKTLLPGLKDDAQVTNLIAYLKPFGPDGKKK